ncbi:MAG: hypothetical protein AAFY41_07280 [Bacteroidota bacterium]
MKTSHSEDAMADEHIYTECRKTKDRVGVVLIELCWVDEDRYIFQWTFSDEWTRFEFHSALIRSRTMLQVLKHSVSIVLDLRTGMAPDNLLTLAQQGFAALNCQVEQVIIVGYLPTWKSLYSILKYTMDDLVIPVKFVATLRQVKGHLNAYRHDSSSNR